MRRAPVPLWLAGLALWLSGCGSKSPGTTAGEAWFDLTWGGAITRDEPFLTVHKDGSVDLVGLPPFSPDYGMSASFLDEPVHVGFVETERLAELLESLPKRGGAWQGLTVLDGTLLRVRRRPPPQGDLAQGGTHAAGQGTVSAPDLGGGGPRTRSSCHQVLPKMA